MCGVPHANRYAQGGPTLGESAKEEQFRPKMQHSQTGRVGFVNISYVGASDP